MKLELVPIPDHLEFFCRPLRNVRLDQSDGDHSVNLRLEARRAVPLEEQTAARPG
jgi:hypothetical protein